MTRAPEDPLKLRLADFERRLQNQERHSHADPFRGGRQRGGILDWAICELVSTVVSGGGGLGLTLNQSPFVDLDPATLQTMPGSSLATPFDGDAWRIGPFAAGWWLLTTNVNVEFNNTGRYWSGVQMYPWGASTETYKDWRPDGSPHLDTNLSMTVPVEEGEGGRVRVFCHADVATSATITGYAAWTRLG